MRCAFLICSAWLNSPLINLYHLHIVAIRMQHELIASLVNKTFEFIFFHFRAIWNSINRNKSLHCRRFWPETQHSASASGHRAKLSIACIGRTNSHCSALGSTINYVALSVWPSPFNAGSVPFTPLYIDCTGRRYVAQASANVWTCGHT